MRICTRRAIDDPLLRDKSVRHLDLTVKINQAIATRCDQLAETFRGMFSLASARYWLKFVHTA